MASKRRLEISRQKTNEILQSQTVRQALQAKARRILPMAKAIALSDGQSKFANALTVTDGTRPGTHSPTGLKRSYARIGAEITEDMQTERSYKLTRQQILRRAGSG